MNGTAFALSETAPRYEFSSILEPIGINDWCASEIGDKDHGLSTKKLGVQLVFYLSDIVLQFFLNRDALLNLLARMQHSSMVSLQA